MSLPIVVHGAKATQLYPLVGKYGGHVGYQFGDQWYMVAVEQQRRGDDFDLYWDESTAVDIEAVMPWDSWLLLRTR